jgi:transcriptional regulator with XRE-family HTH domain
MVNTDDFIKRLEIILDYYNLNASSFADKISVQRSSMSHLLSGRNKPSLDFILKIIAIFPDVDLYWILNGIGSFPKNSESNKNSNAVIQNLDAPASIDLFSQNSLAEEKESVQEKEKQIIRVSENQNSDEVEKIVFFYKNGTFKTYKPNS